MRRGREGEGKGRRVVKGRGQVSPPSFSSWTRECAELNFIHFVSVNVFQTKS